MTTSPLRLTHAGCLLVAGLLLAPLTATAQTALSTASNGLSCARDRAGSNLTCSAGEFTTIVNLQTPPGSPTTCIAGETITLSLILNLSGTNAYRYDGAIFVGQSGNDPRAAGGVCAVSRFPIASSGTGFTLGDADGCGDYIAGGVETWRVDNVQILCTADAATGQLAVPYLLSYQQNNPGVCSADTSVLLAPGSPSKCNAGTATVPTLVVQGYVDVTKQTLPDGAAGTFNFSASASLGTPSPTAFSLSDGQTQRVAVNVTGTARTVTITEAALGGWENAANIVCTNPSGGAAPYVTVNNATRTITATLDSTNFGAACTITNTRQTRVQTSKVLSPLGDAGLFNLTAGPTTVNNQGNGGTTGLTAITAGSSATFSETAGTGTSLANYISTYVCTRADTGATVASGSGTSVTLTPAVQTDTHCIFSNQRRIAEVFVRKTNTPGVNGDVDQAGDTVVSGTATTYTITVNNQGPHSADGTVLMDPVPTNLTCPTATCTAGGGATCPAQTGAALVAALQGAGATIPLLPLGGSVVVTLSCTVN